MHTILLRAAAEAGGALPFVRFMELALYHPEQGYYMQQRSRIGRSGDFVTAPEVTSLFGELLALQWFEVWELLGCPERFDLVELGAGTGQLAVDLLTTARHIPGFARALHYVIVERSPDFQAVQERMLTRAGAQGQVSWQASLESLSASLEQGLVGGILSNEFFDALPVHWLEMTADGWRELGAAWTGDAWQAVTIPLTPAVDPDYFSRRGLQVTAGYRTELGLEGQAWMQRLGKMLRRGVILTIDYGYPEREYHHPHRPAGRLVGHRHHERVDDPLAFPGEMDLTAHVDFSALARMGRASGLETLGFTSQGWFLMGLGILTRLEKLLAGDKVPPAIKKQLPGAVQRLIMPDAMGERFKVLAQGTGLPPGSLLAGFRLNDQCQRL
ncbi:MAG: SAM-dependent methyltransferase [Magnetococcus sp. DMHC-1]